MLDKTAGPAFRIDGDVAVVAAVAALTIFRLLAMAHIGLVPDEAYYWLWSKAPSAGYYDHPPMIAWWIWLSTKIAGEGAFGVRLFPVLSIAVTSWATYMTAIELFGDRAIARTAAIWVNAMFLIGLEHVFATPDAPSTMFWALTTLALSRLRRTGYAPIWLVVGLLAGAGCVSKYTNLFLGLGILAWLALDPAARRFRFDPWVFLGGAVAFLTFLPVLVWNAFHHWVSFEKQFGRIGHGAAGNSHTAEFLAGQIGLINPVLAVLASVTVWTYLRRRPLFARSPQTFLIALNAPLCLYMIVQSLHDRVHPNWTAPLYPAMAILASLAATDGLSSTWLVRVSRWATPIGIGLTSLILAAYATPLGRNVPLRSPADNVLGWRGLYRGLDDMRHRNAAQWIATTDYGLTAELAFQAKGEVPIIQIVDRQRYTFENPDPSVLDKTGLLVVSAAEEERFDRYKQCFGASSPVETIHREAGDRQIELYFVVTVSRAPADLLSTGCGL
ncbi:glycosyltransferase family 39 protein [Rhizobium sp. BK376]|uniref:glycosyltransferase family 39 protein n=1 Tax=Rhizobium sp. BK376 TaxID=2512149 RepID=UPI00105127D2|nr:glycosyltransferase family 39 protein [Rhizobium sp. BK376]TCR76694.1 dolichyl-phosphate-mannose-protein mannosyltransferase [Rhizobium sp. BK376]